MLPSASREPALSGDPAGFYGVVEVKWCGGFLGPLGAAVAIAGTWKASRLDRLVRDWVRSIR